MQDFSYRRAQSIADAVDAVRTADDGTFLAGGQTLLPTLKQRLAAPSDLVDLSGIAELTGISVSGDTVTIGAMTPHAAVAASGAVREVIPALCDMADGIGDPQVRNRGTIGGSIANNDPAADYPAACVALGATITTDRRAVAADDFFTGLFETALGEDEVIVSVSFPRPQAAAYMKFPNPASRYALVGVFVARTGGGVRVAVTGAGDDGVFRARAMEAALSASFSAESISDDQVSADGLMSDLHGGADYRANLVAVMARRAVAAAR